MKAGKQVSSLSGRRPLPRYFESNKLMAKARDPKPEIRKKSEGRSSKGASPAVPVAAPTRRPHASPTLVGRPFLRSTPTEIAVRSGATAKGINVGQASRLSVVPRPKGSGTTLSHAPAKIGQRRSDASLIQTGETPILRPVRISGFFRNSGFGLRISLYPIPLKTAKNR
jgi:hypothetical protein